MLECLPPPLPWASSCTSGHSTTSSLGPSAFLSHTKASFLCLGCLLQTPTHNSTVTIRGLYWSIWPMNRTPCLHKALAIIIACLMSVYSLGHKLWARLNASYPVLAPSRFAPSFSGHLPKQAAVRPSKPNQALLPMRSLNGNTGILSHTSALLSAEC